MVVAKIPPLFNDKKINGIQTAKLDTVLKSSMNISQEEFNKYYIDNKGIVYHEGFVYEGSTYYNRNSNTNISQVPPTQCPVDGTYCTSKGVNSPRLASGMIAVYWDPEGKEVTSSNPGDDPNFDYNLWYDYKEQTTNTTSGGTSKWANARTSDGSYWVWIPRYGYSITSGYHTSTAGVIEVEFLKDKTNTSTSGRTTYDNVAGQGKWNIHPAFYYTNEDNTIIQLSGFWVAKYEMSMETNGVSTNTSNATIGNLLTSSTIKSVSKPGVTSWRYINRNNMFLNSLNYDTNNLNNAQLDSHQMKNIEWGAVAYLSYSKYGRNKTEVSVNTSELFYTGGGNEVTAHSNVLQSTTGNCYGVFDMSGGAYEHVAAYIYGIDVNNIHGSDIIKADCKYKDVYDIATITDYGEINDIIAYGDAIYETSAGCDITNGNNFLSWYGNYSAFINLEIPFMCRGGIYGGGSNSGLFSYVYNGGASTPLRSWRIILWNS